MKGFAKLLAVLLIVSMFMTFGLTAHADPPVNGKITVNWPDELDTNNSYELYTTGLWKLFDATIGKDEDGNFTDAIAYTYSGTAEQIAIINGGGFFHVDEAGNATATEDAVQVVDGVSFLTSEAAEWLKENIADIGEKITLKTPRQWSLDGRKNDDPYYDSYPYRHQSVFHNLPWGYYYLESTVGSLVMVDSTHPDVVIKDKNNPPELTKTITDVTDADGNAPLQEDKNIVPDGQYGYRANGDTATIQIGDKVEYTLDFTVKPGAENYILYDSQSAGLELIPDSIEIYLVGSDGENETLTAFGTANYELYAAANPSTILIDSVGLNEETGLYDFQILKCTNDPETGTSTEQIDTVSRPFARANNLGANIQILFEQDWLDTITADTALRVVYQCTVTKDAMVGGNTGGNPNTATLIFTREGKTISDFASLYSAEIVVYKYEGEGESGTIAGSKPLNGVKFILQRSDGKYLYQDENQAVHWVADKASATEFVTGGDGAEEIITLEPMDWWYYLNPGADGEYGTADDFASSMFGEAMIFVGPDGALGTADDVFFVSGADPKYTVTPGEDDLWGTGDEVMKSADGYAFIRGLTNGTYTLIETYALPGYNVASPITLTINNRTNTYSELKQQVEIANQTGTELPNTGGMGVTLFYLLGGMSVLLGAALLLRKKNAQGV